MIAEALVDLAVPITDLRPLDGNPRRGDVKAVARSLKRFGQRKPIVIDADGIVLAGNHTLAAALELGWTEVAVVRVTDDPATGRAYALADNRTSSLGTFDTNALAAMVADVHAVDPELLLAASYDDDDVASLLSRTGARGSSDDVPESDSLARRAEPGDVWRLGPHRVMCGDATDPAAREVLLEGARTDVLFTDPPYGQNLDTDYRKMGGGGGLLSGTMPKKYRPVIGDDEPFDPAPVLELWAADAREVFLFGADHYCTRLPGVESGSWLVWDKRSAADDEVEHSPGGKGSDEGFGSGFELIWSRTPHKRMVLRHFWFGAFGSRGEASGRMHPTQKPTALLEDVIERWTKKGCVIVDPYAGSGSTIIACGNTGRTCYAVEIDPRYVDVIISRWETLTGDTATKA